MSQESNSVDQVIAGMTLDERYAAWHFYTAVVEDNEAFSVGKKMRDRLRELGLMKWVGGNYFEITEALANIYPTLNGMATTGFKG